MKRLLAILLSLCCLFLVGCETASSAESENQSESSIQEIKDIELVKIETTKQRIPPGYFNISIEFKTNVQIKNLTIEFPVYTYQKDKEDNPYNMIEREIGEIEIGTTIKNGNYKFTYILESSSNWGDFDNLYATIGDISIKSGDIIEETED